MYLKDKIQTIIADSGDDTDLAIRLINEEACRYEYRAEATIDELGRKLCITIGIGAAYVLIIGGIKIANKIKNNKKPKSSYSQQFIKYNDLYNKE